MRLSDTYRLSRQAASLWGKSDYGEGERWLPLFLHMYDSARVARGLWELWVPRGTKATIARAFNGDEALAETAFVFLAGVHDIGKATPAFQSQRISARDDGEAFLDWKPREAGLDTSLQYGSCSRPTHAVAGQLVFERYFEGRFEDDCVRDSYSSIIGNHHGKSPGEGTLTVVEEGFPQALGADDPLWRHVQDELIEFVRVISGFDEGVLDRLEDRLVPAPIASLLVGLVIMTDWIASNTDFFPLLPLLPETPEGRALQQGTISFEQLDGRFDDGWSALGLLGPWGESEVPNLSDGASFAARFGFSPSMAPRPVQLEASRIVEDSPDLGIMVIEAPMGEGKTEAALAAAEMLAARSGCGGVIVALPTMATTDAMFGRVHSWLDRLPVGKGGAKSVYLAHGKAALNEEFRGIIRESHAARRVRAPFVGVGIDEGDQSRLVPDGGAIASDWLFGRKKGLLANFVVCTIDQVLMGALKMKHLALRHLALANKVVILDECHAYDAYMQEYLKRALEWLGSWETPVIMLSATLPSHLRREFVEAYVRGGRASGGAPASAKPASLSIDAQASDAAYPLISYTNGTVMRERAIPPSSRETGVSLSLMDDDEEALVALLGSLLDQGGCAGVVCDTVSRAQRVMGALRASFGDDELVLTHSRYVDIDRMDNERLLRRALGPSATSANGLRPRRLIVVGTQVLEQSLDIDFDVLVTDVAPVDLLFQRVGRLHRHARSLADRPARLRKASCFIRGISDWEGEPPAFPRGISMVYEEAALLEALAVLGLEQSGSKVLVSLPGDIAKKVRAAYSSDMAELIPEPWKARYLHAAERRVENAERKRLRASHCLLGSSYELCWNEQSLTDWCSLVAEKGSSGKRDADWGQRAVRDTQETVEVLLLRESGHEVRLFPWVGNEEAGIERGAAVPTSVAPSRELAALVAQSAVRLPVELCRQDQIDALVAELEERCGDRVGAWQESEYLAGSLVLLMGEDEPGVYSATLCGREVLYSRKDGLSTKSMFE